MRIGLISDTHVPRDVKALPPHVNEAFKGVDLILHAGDIYDPTILDELSTIAPVLAARGIEDPEDRRIKNFHIIDIGGLRLGLIHATVLAELPRRSLEKAVNVEFGSNVDIIAFGHSHVAMIEKYQGSLLVNPGSATLPKGRFELGTVALMEINKGKVKARIVHLDEFAISFKRETVYRRGFGA